MVVLGSCSSSDCGSTQIHTYTAKFQVHFHYQNVEVQVWDGIVGRRQQLRPVVVRSTHANDGSACE